MGIIKEYKKHASLQPNKIAIKENDRALTYKEWFESVCKVANWLRVTESKNKTIAIVLENRMEFLQLFAGAAMAGWVCVPLDVKWKKDELKERLAISNPDMVVTERYKLNDILDEERRVFAIDEWKQIIENYLPRDYLGENVQNTPFYMGFTSGSTGKAKAFLRAQQSWVHSFDCNVHDFHMRKEDSILIAGTLVHSLFLYGAISALYEGQTVHVMRKFIPDQVLDKLETENISVMYTVPTMLESLYKENRIIENKMKIISSGAKWEAEAKEKIKSIFPYAKKYEFYGASELSFVTALVDDESEKKPNSVGKPCHNVQVRICNEAGEEVQLGEIGTVYVKSDQFFMGYILDGVLVPELTEEGWMTVHDVGYQDEEGFIYIVGREKNMILFGGINIYPEEIESVLYTHQAVEEIVVVGVKDSYWGEKPVAIVKGSATKQQLKSFCLQRLSSFKIPKEWYFVDEIPYTNSGKVARIAAESIVRNQEKIHE
ncbi:acyl-CoA synthetase [Bacillus toyonensis]|uniref:acyl-CoA synthetase n=1 Tax=Bacillus toyonensis TaxID=155322 RepID=UPI000B442A44|nr:acyl-CoA synthetase [Bacillus toyonensis]OTX43036.1 acyl-CoA synthetase [Bacillus thuringiensis serovar malayensis]OUB03859.1 acyl-CoA synthetase [Bacillus thuringiensis serovar shandongiensis]MBX0353998.1 acyl-CoA synthetase [Bacillus toyonensis]MDM5257670.1 acyl-CoA synthetase [Bacillus toyonensis]MEC2392697.1 acyl-CoA synthetase [Bacillus toyonensis]